MDLCGTGKWAGHDAVAAGFVVATFLSHLVLSEFNRLLSRYPVNSCRMDLSCLDEKLD